MSAANQLSKFHEASEPKTPALSVNATKALLEEGKIFAWRKKSVRSKEWDTFEHIFEIKDKESSQMPFIRCTTCHAVMTYCSKQGNKKLIDHNGKCNQARPVTLMQYSNSNANITAEEQSLFNLKCSNFVADSLSPFMIVENQSLQELLDYTFKLGYKYGDRNVQHVMPTRKQVKNMIFNEYDKMLSEAKTFLSAIPLDEITCSLDIWTDNSLMNSYIDFSFVFIDASTLRMKYYQYKMDHFPHSHTALNIKEHVWLTCSEIFDSVSNLRVISDSASNMVAGLRDFQHFRCSAHRLNTIISEGISFQLSFL